MLLIAHIIVSCIASITLLSAAVQLARKNSQLSKLQSRAMLSGVGLSVVSGIGLVFSGTSVARVCVEATVLVVSAVAVGVYSRRVSVITQGEL